MALKRNERYPGRFENPTTAQPQGAFKNRTSPTSQDGSYLEADWVNDWSGFFGRLLTLAGVSPNGNVDTASSSQYYNALKSLFLQRTNPFGDINSDGASAIATALSNLGLGEAAKRSVGTGSNQLPDMSAFGMSRNGENAWDILPNGMIRQVGTVGLTPVGNFNAQVLGGVTYYTNYYRISFPRQYPNAQVATLATLACSTYSNQTSMAGKSISTHRDTDSGTGVSKTRFTVAYTTPNLGETPTVHFESIGY